VCPSLDVTRKVRSPNPGSATLVLASCTVQYCYRKICKVKCHLKIWTSEALNLCEHHVAESFKWFGNTVTNLLTKMYNYSLFFTKLFDETISHNCSDIIFLKYHYEGGNVKLVLAHSLNVIHNTLNLSVDYLWLWPAVALNWRELSCLTRTTQQNRAFMTIHRS
jgi:hypothetical protein